MLTTPQETSDILSRIKTARGTSEPALVEPTEASEPVNVLEDAQPVEDVTQDEAAGQDAPLETDESEELEAATVEDGELEELFADYNGREINLKEAVEWEKSHKNIKSMQADCTRKWQEAADLRKKADAELESLNGQKAELAEKLAIVEAMINSDSISDEELAEMREYEPEKYIEYTEKLSKRVEFLKANKKEPTQQPSFDVQAEQQKLWSANPEWLKDGKQTEQFTKDMNLIQSYAVANEYTEQDFSKFKAVDFQTILKAAKFDEMSKKSAVIEKKVRKAPVATKPKAAAQSSLQAEIKKAEDRLAKSGSVQDAVALRKLKRQLNR